jgi:hypothetical protein
VHFLLVVKGSLAHLQGNLWQPMLYGGLALVLLGLRIRKIKVALAGWRTRRT